jgi:hypothetical protein
MAAHGIGGLVNAGWAQLVKAGCKRGTRGHTVGGARGWVGPVCWLAGLVDGTIGPSH